MHVKSMLAQRVYHTEPKWTRKKNGYKGEQRPVINFQGVMHSVIKILCTSQKCLGFFQYNVFFSSHVNTYCSCTSITPNICFSLTGNIPVGSVVKNPQANEGDSSSIPGLGRDPEK